MECEGDRLLNQAAIFQRVNDHTWTISLLTRAFNSFMRTKPLVNYLGAAKAQRMMGEVYTKTGARLSAIQAYTKSGELFDKAGQKRMAMACVATVAYANIELNAYWDALFLLERLSDYYVKVDMFKCNAFSLDACLCIIAMGQMEALAEVFDIYCNRVDYEKMDIVAQLVETHDTRKPLVIHDWFSMVKDHLSHKASVTT